MRDNPKIPNWSVIKAILFDFDGVIVESIDVKTKAFAELYAGYGDEIVHRVVSHHLANGGISRFDKIRHYHKHFLGIDISDQELYIWCNKFSTLVLNDVISSPFVPGVIEFLKDCSGVFNCFIISGTPQEELESIVKAKKLTAFFKAVYGSPRNKKEILASIISTTGIPVSQMIYFGDAITDFNAATSLKVPFIGRIPKNTANPFPSGTLIIRDFYDLNTHAGQRDL